MAETLQPFCLEALSLPSGSISFGRFETEPLLWERRSAFSCNNYLEEVERYSKPGSVNQRKAYFEVFFKRKLGLQQPDSVLCQNWTECQSSQGEYVDNSNHTELLHRESLFECDEESSNCHRDSEVTGKNSPMHEKFSPGLRKSQGETPKVRAESKTPSTRMKTSSSLNVVARDSNKVSKETISKSHTAKQPVKNVSTFKPLLAKNPKSTESGESEKQKYQHARPQKVTRSSTEKTTKSSGANNNGNSRGKVNNKDDGKAARIKQMPAINNTKKAKMRAISPAGLPQDFSGEKAVPVCAETTNSGRKSSDPVREVTSGESISSSTSISIKLPGQPSPSKNKENNLALKHLLRGKQVDTKKRDLSPSVTVTKPSKVPKLQSESSSPSSVCRVPSASSTSSVKQSSKHTDTTESPKKKNLPTKCIPEGSKVTAEEHDVDISKTVSRPTRLAKSQNKPSSPSPVRTAPGASSHSSIKQHSSQCTDSTESPMKNNSPAKCLPGREVKAKKHELDTSQTVSKPTKLAVVQSISSRPSPVLKAPRSSSTSSSTKQLSSQLTKRTESPMKNKFPTTSLPGGKVVIAKKSDLDISQKVSKPTKLAELKHKSMSPSSVLKSVSGSSTSSLKQLSSEFTSRTESPVKNNLPTKCSPGGKEVTATKHDLDSSHTVSRTTKSAKLQRKISSPVVKGATVSSTSSAVRQFIPQPKKENNDVPRKNNEKKIPTTHPPGIIEVVAKNNHLDISRSVSKPTQVAKLQRESSSPGPSCKAGSASLSSLGQRAPKTMKRSETPKKNKNKSKQLGTKEHSEKSSQCEAVSNKYTILEGNSSSAAKGVVRSTAQTNPTKSIGRV